MDGQLTLDDFLPKPKRDQNCLYSLCPTFRKNPKFVEVFCVNCTRYGGD